MNREPDPAEFHRLLKCLDPDIGRACEEYANLRRKLVKFFEGRVCGDAEELASEALDRIAKRPDLDQIRSIREFAVGVARNLCKETYAKQHRERSLEDCPGGAESLADPRDYAEDAAGRIDRDPRMDCLETSLAKLNERDRILAVEYYNSEGAKQHFRRTILAIKYGFTPNALRVRMNRLRDKLEREVTECLNAGGNAEAGGGQGV